ncbi:2-dehydropantoate 2-reductase [Cobetia marina]|uniref:ketopantoate reductase family protein n=1 Tax=Cobetia marina TaxID=28258 RepID=UPI0010AE84CD|nr:2-dehydropantoate 2-reductase [Cobetia marina]TKD64669.1 2-dehydropantoate 2-reductase [Cobetia marina]
MTTSTPADDNHTLSTAFDSLSQRPAAAGDWLWIVGPGAIGRLLAATLAHARLREMATQGRSTLPNLLLVGRRASVSEMVTIDMTSPEGQSVSSEITYTSINQLRTLPYPPPAAIWLTTKSHTIESAWAHVAPLIDSRTPVTCWQNGLSAQPWLAEQHPQLLCASTTEGAWIPESTALATHTLPERLAVQHAGHGQTWLGTWSSQADPTSSSSAMAAAERQVAWLQAAGRECHVSADIGTRLWHKLAINAAINPLVARFRIRNGQLRDRPFSLMVRQAVDEITRVLEAEGIAPPSNGWQALVDQVIRATANNRASMLQDVLAGRTTEVEAILGPLRHAALRHGLSLTDDLPLLEQLHTHLSSQQP